MPSKPRKTTRPARVTGKKIARKARGAKGALTKQRVKQTGVSSRVRGHVSARGKRAQARRDSR